jgi:hypothetical protein
VRPVLVVVRLPGGFEVSVDGRRVPSRARGRRDAVVLRDRVVALILHADVAVDAACSTR